MRLSLVFMIAGLIAPAADAAPSLAPLSAVSPKLDCTALTKVDLSHAVGAAVSDLTATKVEGDKPHCKVTGTIAPAIRFAVQLPSVTWTQRFLQTGCGGLCGNLRINAEKARGCTPVTNGEIALASTDMGHQGNDMAWGNDRQKREDFAHRGVHLTSVVAKALINVYYGQAPRFSYFAGCSDGGREALMAAQRYPSDYDGIAAGAPALNFTVQNSFHHASLALANSGPDGRPILNPVDMPTLRKAALKACDAKDGLRDDQITDPRQCRFDPGVTLCKGAYQAGHCLSRIQVAAARRIYEGPRDERGRPLTLGGPLPGSELGWPGVFVPRDAGGTIFSTRIALDTINNLLWTPNPSPPQTLASFQFTAANFASMDAARRLYNADDANLTSFSSHGGKIMLWHGWNDQHISPINSIDYFSRTGIVMGKEPRDAMMRLFLLPGVAHCSGGDGPSDFPLLQTLMTWVESGHAPDVMIAMRAPPTRDGLPVGVGGLRPAGPAGPFADLPPRSRPIYAYPQIARFSGKGSPDDAENFVPVASPETPLTKWAGRR